MSDLVRDEDEAFRFGLGVVLYVFGLVSITIGTMVCAGFGAGCLVFGMLCLLGAGLVIVSGVP